MHISTDDLDNVETLDKRRAMTPFAFLNLEDFYPEGSGGSGSPEDDSYPPFLSLGRCGVSPLLMIVLLLSDSLSKEVVAQSVEPVDIAKSGLRRKQL